MTFLATVLSDLAVKILTWIYGKVSSWLIRALRMKEKYAHARSLNKRIRQQTEQAETKEERKRAVERSADHF